ncbi:low molecular weight protein-tyrosine-phosphatase [Bacillus sp. JJ722]|uniref:low molecular weight protein-tyrosine-phosphatase n=1 Tax=Bacillus sp. JJ722 TaxID=3122973 RepID=UPI003000DF92
MVNVLFVCLGNICRSPMAEAMFRDLVKREGLDDRITIDSAGTGDWHIGHQPHQGTRDLLDRKEISYEGMKARQMVTEDYDTYQYIIAMDTSNIENMKQWQEGNTEAYVGRLLDLVPDVQNKDVPDPYFTGNFDEVYDLVNKGCQALLQKIKTEQGL